MDLQSGMPATFTTSFASSISGDTIYGYATDTAGNYHAIAWTVSAPEPAGLALAGVAAVGLLGRRAKRPKITAATGRSRSGRETRRG